VGGNQSTTGRRQCVVDEPAGDEQDVGRRHFVERVLQIEVEQAVFGERPLSVGARRRRLRGRS
jgi:hypothetical protein